MAPYRSGAILAERPGRLNGAGTRQESRIDRREFIRQQQEAGTPTRTRPCNLQRLLGPVFEPGVFGSAFPGPG